MQRSEQKRDAVRQGKGSDDFQKLTNRSAKEHQPDNEKNVVGSNEDVMDSFPNKLTDNRKNVLPRIRDIIDARGFGIEDGLMLQLSAVVNIQESFVTRIESKKVAMDANRLAEFRGWKLQLHFDFSSGRQQLQCA